MITNIFYIYTWGMYYYVYTIYRYSASEMCDCKEEYVGQPNLLRGKLGTYALVGYLLVVCLGTLPM